MVELLVLQVGHDLLGMVNCRWDCTMIAVPLWLESCPFGQIRLGEEQVDMLVCLDYLEVDLGLILNYLEFGDCLGIRTF